uniref:C3H1-type domain-containing protein n=1 Tax=Macrostomum lignano TaxID=282301 RepID=A0A1I8F5I4_9PLAT
TNLPFSLPLRAIRQKAASLAAVASRLNSHAATLETTTAEAGYTLEIDMTARRHQDERLIPRLIDSGSSRNFQPGLEVLLAAKSARADVAIVKWSSRACRLRQRTLNQSQLAAPDMLSFRGYCYAVSSAPQNVTVAVSSIKRRCSAGQLYSSWADEIASSLLPPELRLPDLGLQGLYSTSARPSGPAKPLLVKEFINRDGEEPAFWREVQSPDRGRSRRFGEFMHQGFSQAASTATTKTSGSCNISRAATGSGIRWQLLSKHILAKATIIGQSSSRPGFVGPIDPEGRELCVKFNRNSCLRRDCKFRHVCYVCYEAHRRASSALQKLDCGQPGRSNWQRSCPGRSESRTRRCRPRLALSKPLDYRQLVEHQVGRKVLNGRYFPVSDKPEVISTIGAIPKSNNKIRHHPGLLQTLRRLSLNSADFLSDYRIKFETSFTPSCKSVGSWPKVDLTNAYRSVGISPHDFRLTGLKLEIQRPAQRLVHLRHGLPFGLCPAPSGKFFTALSQAVKRMVQRRGFNDIVSYRDELRRSSLQQGRLPARSATLCSICWGSLAFSINWSKVVAPCTKLVYWASHRHTVSGLQELPEDKPRRHQSALSRKRIKQAPTPTRSVARIKLGLPGGPHREAAKSGVQQAQLGPFESDASNWGGCGMHPRPDITSWLIMDCTGDSTEIEPLHINLKKVIAPVLTALYFYSSCKRAAQLIAAPQVRSGELQQALPRALPLAFAETTARGSYRCEKNRTPWKRFSASRIAHRPAPDRLCRQVRAHTTAYRAVRRLSSMALQASVQTLTPQTCTAKGFNDRRAILRDPRIDAALHSVQRKHRQATLRARRPIGDLLKRMAALLAAVLVGFWDLLRRDNAVLPRKPFTTSWRGGHLRRPASITGSGLFFLCSSCNIRRSKPKPQFNARAHRCTALSLTAPPARGASKPRSAWCRRCCQLTNPAHQTQPTRARAAHTLFAYPKAAAGLTPLTGTRLLSACFATSSIVPAWQTGLCLPHSLRRAAPSLAFRAGVPLPVEVYLGWRRPRPSSWRLFETISNGLQLFFLPAPGKKLVCVSALFFPPGLELKCIDFFL